MGEWKDREHLANKVGKDAISSILKDYNKNFPLEHGGEGSMHIKPFKYDESWVEDVYNAVGTKAAIRLVLRIKILSYKKIQTCHPGITYYNNGHETHCVVYMFKEDGLVSEMYSNIKEALTKILKEHKLYQMDSNEFTDTIKKVMKTRADSNLLLLL
jgi:hypothetical protein